ncbi:MAG: Hsp70 family protein [Pseudomonadota bacterium]
MKNKREKIKLGIDLGTTHTMLVRADAPDYPVLSLPFEYRGKRLVVDRVPTAITLYQGKYYFGPAAEACFLDRFDEGALLRGSLKRLLHNWREGQTVEFDNASPLVDDLLTAFLQELRAAALRSLKIKNADIEAVIAVPANASSSQRFVTLDCFKRAGFDVLHILDEPSASGIQFIHERYKRWDRVETEAVIYDLGGGTFDACLLSIEKGRRRPVLSLGINRLGGDDFDEALLELGREKLGRELGGREKARLLRRAREVKESIGPYTQKLELDFGDQIVSLTVKEYYEALAPWLDRTADLVERLSLASRGTGDGPSRVVMVGGGSLLPLAAKKLRDRFGRARVHLGSRPFASVALGCAIQAGRPDIRTPDRLHNHFGVMRVREDRGEYIDIIFEKGTVLPPRGETVRVEKGPYPPWHDIGRFRYLEFNDWDDETRNIRGDRVDWNEIIFPFDRDLTPDDGPSVDLEVKPVVSTLKLETEKILEEYFLDSHGIITVRLSRTVQDDFSNCYNLFRKP